MGILKVYVNSHCFLFFPLLLANRLKDLAEFQLSSGNKFSISVKFDFYGEGVTYFEFLG